MTRAEQNKSLPSLALDPLDGATPGGFGVCRRTGCPDEARDATLRLCAAHLADQERIRSQTADIVVHARDLWTEHRGGRRRRR